MVPMCGGVALLLGGVLACTDARSSSFLLDSLGTNVLEAGKALVRPAGEARRSTLDSTGAGFEFRADVAWPSVIARLVAPDTLELLLGNTTTTDDRFWRELAFIAGARHEGALASGV